MDGWEISSGVILFVFCGGLGGGLPPQMSVQMTSRDGGRSWAFVLHVVLAVVLSSLSLSPSPGEEEGLFEMMIKEKNIEFCFSEFELLSNP